jgi:hypothetical protein
MAGMNPGEFVNCTPLSNVPSSIVGTGVSVVRDFENSRVDHIMADREGLNKIKTFPAIPCTMIRCADWK